MKTGRVWVAALVGWTMVGWALVGCGKDESAPPTTATTSGSAGGPGSGGSGATGGAGGSGGGGGMCEQCNCLVNEAPEVDWIQLDQPMPQPTGGLIRIGVYWLTAVTLYTDTGGPTGPTGKKWKLTMEFVGPPKGPLADVVVDQLVGDGDERYSFAYQPDDMGVISFSSSGNPLCGGAINVPWSSYTYTEGDPSVLTLYAQTTNSKIGFAFDQQSSPDGTAGHAGAP